MRNFHPERSVNIERFSLIAAYLILIGMMAILSSTFSYFGNVLSPGWDGRFLIFLGVFVAFETIISHPSRERLVFPEKEWLIFHTTEWLLILLVVKTVVELRHGIVESWLQLQFWDENFLNEFFSREVLFSIVCIYAVWLISVTFSYAIWMMKEIEKPLRMNEDGLILQDRWLSRRRLGNLILSTGALQVLIVATLRSESFSSWVQMPQMRGGVFNALTYFALGLMLLSLGQLSSLKTRWNINRVNVIQQISNSWIRYSLIFLFLLVMLAFLLPTGYTVGLLGVLQYSLYLIGGLVTLLVWLIFLPVGWLLSVLGSLFGRTPVRSIPGDIVPLPTPLINDQARNVAIPDYLRSLIFWAVALGMVVYAVVYYLKSRGDVVEKLRNYRWMRWLNVVLRWMVGLLDGMNRSVGGALEAGIERVRELVSQRTLRNRFEYVNPRRLPHRAQVRFYFLSLLRRFRERGLGRKESQSPYEYAEWLRSKISETTDRESELNPEEDISTITERFVQARYSLEDFDDLQVRGVEQAWQRLRRVLGRLSSNKTAK